MPGVAVPDMAWAVAVLWLAVAIDRCLGEPPSAWHPVVWMGRYLSWMGQRVAPTLGQAPPGRDLRRGFKGALAWAVGALTVVGVAGALQTVLLAQAPVWLACLVGGFCLKPLWTWRLLQTEVQAVEQALARSLSAGQERLSWLCSRDTTVLSASEVRETALESLAENFNDSVVAPLFWFAVAGLPGAALYRFANTADAMWGYRGCRDGRVWEWAGKWAAWADDGLSWLPARCSALCIALASGGVPPAALWAQARLTPSPNGGWPMGALALGLQRRLGKPGVYVLNPLAAPPQAADTPRALRIVNRAAWFWWLALSLLGCWRWGMAGV